MANIRVRKSKAGTRYQVRWRGGSRTVNRLEDARALKREMERREDLGDLYQEPARTFGELAQEWLARWEHGRAGGTVKRAEHALKNLAGLDGMLVTHVNRGVFDDELHRIKGGRARQLAHQHGLRVLRYARDRRQPVPADVFTTPVPKHKAKAHWFLTWEQVEEIASFMPARVERAVPFMALTGLRIDELCGLRAEDVDVKAGSMLVNGTKTQASRRTLPLSQQAATLAAEQLLARAPGSRFLFPKQDGDRMPPTRLWKHWTAATRHAGFPAPPDGPTPHALRHTFASLLIKAGVHPAQGALLMGHSDGGKLFLGTYGHLYEQAGRDAVQALDRLLDKPARQEAEHG